MIQIAGVLIFLATAMISIVLAYIGEELLEIRKAIDKLGSGQKGNE